MRSWKSFAAVALGIALVLFGGCSKSGAPPPSAPVESAAIVATCASTHGEVTARPPGAPYWEPVKVGSVFRVADWVRTGELSSARVEFLSGGGLELEPKTILVIDRPPSKKAGEPAATRVALQEGMVRGFLPEASSSLSAPLTPLLLRTSDGRELTLAASDGKRAEFRLEQRNGKTEVAMLSGSARITTESGERSLVAGQFAQLGAQGLDSNPEELIDFPPSVSPGVDARFHGNQELAVELRWSEVAGATGYRVQVARDLSFQQLMVDEDLAGVMHAFRPHQMGMFAWRVASRDRDGRLGEFGFARRVFVEIEQPKELLIGPAQNAVVRIRPEDPIVFTWAAAGDGHYRFVLAKSADLLASQISARSLTAAHLEFSGIQPGEYHWGVYLERSNDELEPIFLASRKLVVRRAAQAKVNTPTAIRDWGG